jgi:PAS domain S-box-containing protein
LTGASPSFRTPTLLEAIVESAPDGILVVDDDARIRMANRQSEVLFQYPRQELVGQPIDLLLPERHRAGHRASVAGYSARPASRPMGSGLNIVARRRDGTEFAADITLSPISIDLGTFVVAAVRDVTERRSLEEQRQRLAEETRTHREREQITLELQDSLLQVAYGVGLSLVQAREPVHVADPDAGRVLDEAIDDLDGLILRVRELILVLSGPSTAADTP